MSGIKLSILSEEALVNDLLEHAQHHPLVTLNLGSHFGPFLCHSSNVMETLGSLCASVALANRDEEKLGLALHYYNHSSKCQTLKHALMSKAIKLGLFQPKPYLDLIFPHFIPLITFSITSGKRLDLFIKTMDSFLHHCLDHRLVHQWLCVDDNSSEQDRDTMKKRYPFMHFICKSEDEKGHAKSMQMIVAHCKTPYLVHFEDDRQLIDPNDYLARMLTILTSQSHLGQIVFNENYMEIPDDTIKGGHWMRCNALDYIEHEYCPTEEEKEAFFKKHGRDATHCHYYPHFSLSPSMIRTDIFKQVQFKEEDCFEYQFGLRYVGQHYRTAFLPGFHVLHTGRLTKERFSVDQLNAYDLIGTQQFYPLVKFKSFMINLERRPDRWQQIEQQKKWLPPNLIRVPAVDGKTLAFTPRLGNLCLYNNYHMRPGVIGCALSHLQLYGQLIRDQDVSAYLIFEDDVSITTQDLFMPKVRRILSTMDTQQPLILFFTTVLQPQVEFDEALSEQKMVRVTTRNDIYTWSIGGTGCYYISKGAAHLALDHVHKYGIDVAIDAILFSLVEEVHMFFALPPLIFQQNDPISDIQHDHSTVSHLLEPFKNYCEANVGEQPYLYNDEGRVELI